MSSEFGNLLRRYRSLRGLSQAKLQDKIDAWGHHYDKSAISKWETGLHVPPFEVVEILEDILLPKSEGLLLKAAGYRYQAEDRYDESRREEDERIASKLRPIILNLEKYLGDDAAVLCYSNTVSETFYGDGSAPATLAKLKPIDREEALEVLIHIKEEFPELMDLNDWAELPHERITEDFIQRLFSRAHRGN